MASRVQHLHFSGLSRLTGPQARLYLQFLYLHLIHIETSSNTLQSVSRRAADHMCRRAVYQLPVFSTATAAEKQIFKWNLTQTGVPTPNLWSLSDLILRHDWQSSPKPTRLPPCSGTKTFLCDKEQAWEPIWAPDPQHQQRASEPSNQKGSSI